MNEDFEQDPSDNKLHPVTLLVPETLFKEYVDKADNNIPIRYKNKNLKSLYLLDIVSTLVCKYHSPKKEVVACLSSEFLRKKYGADYKYYINYLLDESILILHKNHIAGVRSKMYRLNNNHLYCSYKHHKVFDTVFTRKCRKNDEAFCKKYCTSPIPEDIKQYVLEDLKQVTIDYEGAQQMLDVMYKMGEIDEKKYNSNCKAILSIHCGQHYNHFDAYGRVHTNFTSLKKEIRRNYLRINGQHVVEFDIKNCQPSLLIGLLADNIDKIDKKEFNKYVEYCLDGTFYRQLARAKGHIFMTNPDKSAEEREKQWIKEAKNQAFRVLFGTNCDTAENRIFKRCFPTIFKFIVDYKSEKGSYKKLSHELQRRESDLIFNKIYREVKETYPAIIMFTVHDSILCQQYLSEFVGKVFNKAIKNEFQKFVTA